MLRKERRICWVIKQALQQHRLSQGNKFHLRCDDALTRVVHLTYILPAVRAARDKPRRKAQMVREQISFALTSVSGSGTAKNVRIVAPLDPFRANVGQSTREVNAYISIGVRTGSIVNRQGRILLGAIRVVRSGKSDLPVRNTKIPMIAA